MLPRIAGSSYCGTKAALASLVMVAFLVSGCIGRRPEGVWKHPSYQGVVLDTRTRLPVAGASVLWQEGNISAITDESGRFSLPGVEGPKWSIVGFSDQLQARTLLITHLLYQERRLEHRHVLYGDPIEELGEILLTPRTGP